MTALMLEAFLNHAGRELVEMRGKPEVWAALEKARPLEKLRALAELADYDLNLGKSPFQEFKPLFAFRNAIVHAKTTVLQANEAAAGPDGLPQIGDVLTAWEQSWTVDQANRWLDAADDMIHRFCSATGCNDPLRSYSLIEWKEV